VKKGKNMEVILLIGIQASGKSTFYKEKYFNSHIRISNDLLKTKNREKKLLEYCLNTQMSFVVDNTNSTKETRKKYIDMVREFSIPVIGYYFKSDLNQSLDRNEKRSKKEFVPRVGVLSTYNKLEIPKMDEGFTKLYYVENINDFIIKEWEDEV